MAGTTVGEIHIALVFDSGDVNKRIAALEDSLSGMADTADKKGSKAFSALKAVAAGAIGFVTAKIAGGLSNNLDGAIKRVDTLKNANRVFEAMGYAADDVSASMDSLNTYLDGLPTSLDSAVGNVQLLSASFGGIENGTKIFKAMNDAGLAFGATTADIDNAIRQLSQLSMDGPLDAQTWNSLTNSGFGPALAKMAEQSGVTMGELKKQFGGNGTKTVGEFIDMLEKMDTEGTDSMESLASMARKNTDGIGTAITNLNSRIQKAIGEIINGIGEENIADIINTISKAIVKAGKAVGNFLSEHMEDIKSAIRFVVDHGKEIAVTIGIIAGAFVAAGIVEKVSGLVGSFKKVAGAVGGLFKAKDAVTELGDAANKAPKTFTFGESISSFFKNIGTVISGAAQGIGTALSGLVTMIMEPVKALFKGVGEAIAGFFKALSNPSLIMGAINFALISAAVAAAIWLIGNAVGAIMPTLVALFNNIIAPGVTLLVWAITEITNNLIRLTQQALIPLINTAVNGVVSIVTVVVWGVTTIISTVSGALDRIVGTISAFPSRVLGFIDQVRAFFVDKFNAAKNAARSAVDSIVSFVTGIPGKISAKVGEIKTKIKDAIDGAKDAVKSAVDSIVEFITGIPDRLGDIGSKIGEKISGSVSGAVEGVKSAIGGILSGIPGLATGGYVKATPGGTLAVIGEGGEDEFVIPRSQMIDLLTGVSTASLDNELPADEVRTGGGIIINNHFTINSEMDADDIGRRINNSIRRATI